MLTLKDFEFQKNCGCSKALKNLLLFGDEKEQTQRDIKLQISKYNSDNTLLNSRLSFEFHE